MQHLGRLGDCARYGSPSRRCRRVEGGGRGGVALLEVMLALALLTGAVVGLAGLFTVAARANRLSRTSTLAAMLASQKMEQLMALAWGYGPAGEDRVDLHTDVSIWPETTAGGGLRESPPGALRSNIAGFVDYLDEQGSWIGNGLSPPGRTVYVRRWSIRALPDSPLDTLVIRVVVLPRGSEGIPIARGIGPPGAVQVTCVRSRRGT